MHSKALSMAEILDLLAEPYVILNSDDIASIIALNPDEATIEKIFVAARTVNVPNTLTVTTTTTSASVTVKVGTASFDIRKTATSCVLYSYITSSNDLAIDVIDESDFNMKKIPVFVTTLVELDDAETLPFANTIFGFTGNGAITKTTAVYRKDDTSSVTVTFTRADGNLSFSVSGEKIVEDTIQIFDSRKIRKDSPRQFLVPLNHENQDVPEQAEEVSTGEALLSAINDATVSDIRIEADLQVPNLPDITRTVFLSGQGLQRKLTRVGTNNKSLVVFSRSENSVISNLILDSALAAPGTWNSNYGFQVYRGSASAENVTITGGNAAMIINSSTMTLSGLIDVSGNGFGGIEVSKSKSVQDATAGILYLAPGTILVNTTEAPGQPTIWIDGVAEVDGILNNLSSVVLYEHNTGTQVHYYLKAANVPKA